MTEVVPRAFGSMATTSMAKSKFYPSTAVLRHLRQSLDLTHCPYQRCSLQRRGLHQARALREEGRSFRGQLYDSTFQRLERERAEQRRLAKEQLAPKSLSSRFTWATGISTIFLENSMHQLTVLSDYNGRRWRILVGNIPT